MKKSGAGIVPHRPTYPGVSLHRQTGRFEARLGRVFLGRYETARDAAIARDRAALHLGIDVALAFPKTSRRLGPASPEELRRQAVTRQRRHLATESNVRAVVCRGRSENPRWSARSTAGRADAHDRRELGAAVELSAIVAALREMPEEDVTRVKDAAIEEICRRVWQRRRDDAARELSELEKDAAQ